MLKEKKKKGVHSRKQELLVQRPCGRKTFDRRPRELEVRRGGRETAPLSPGRRAGIVTLDS